MGIQCPPWVRDALRDRNAEVLVQGDKPVPLWIFLEERTAQPQLPPQEMRRFRHVP